MPDEVVESMVFTFPWDPQSQGVKKDEDGFPIEGTSSLSYDSMDFKTLQKECWNKFVKNPQINSHVRDVMGSLTGYGYQVTSAIPEIQEAIEDIEEDIRNSLYKNMSKYVARAEVEGELFLGFTVHPDGFVEIDFWDPSTLTGVGEDNSGIIYHPKKPTMPLAYNFQFMDDAGMQNVQVPSINVAYLPSLKKELQKSKSFIMNRASLSTSKSKKYRKLGGFYRFIVEWDKGFITPRNTSHIRTTIEWLNYYEMLKKWEIDHKRSSGAYLWVVKITDAKAYRMWLSLSDEEKKKTGIMEKKTPGGTLVLPPGVDIECINPSLTNISEQDTDIMHMVTSGLNKPEDMVTGQTKGDTFSGIKASRGPQADRVQDEIAYFERFLRFDFWRSIFHLKSAVSGFPTHFEVDKTVGFKNKNPIKKKVKQPVHKLIEFDFPQSEVSNVEGKAKAFLGVNHPSVAEVLGIPREEVAKKLGFNNYRALRQKTSAEEDFYPDLPLTADVLANQQKKTPKDTGVPPKDKNKPKEENNS